MRIVFMCYARRPNLDLNIDPLLGEQKLPLAFAAYECKCNDVIQFFFLIY